MLEELKAGYKTTEFWVSTLGAVALFLASIGVIPIDGVDTVKTSTQAVGLAGTSISIAVYAVIRLFTKRAHSAAQASVAAARVLAAA
jgi:hypothetical protein